jgi:alanine dehydrogenase
MVLVLSERDVAAVLEMADGVRIVEQALRTYADGQSILGPRVSQSLPGNGGAIRVMSAILPHAEWFGLKTLTGSPGHRSSSETYFALLLFEMKTGALRAVIAANYLTGIRTGAASGVAAKYLAREDADVLGIFGAGIQARHQVAAILAVRQVRLVKVFDRDHIKATAFARWISTEFGLEAQATESTKEVVTGSRLVVAATTSREPVFSGEWLEPGTHLSGVGANTPVKRELDTTCFRRSKIVVDSRDQALKEAGDLREALSSGTITADQVHAELGEVITGRKVGRSSGSEITLFKSVGIAVEDIATAAYVYEQAIAKDLGARLALAEEAHAKLSSDQSGPLEISMFGAVAK